MPYSVRRANSQDIPRILELMGELRPGCDVAARHEWLYERNPAGPAATFLAVDDQTGESAGMVNTFPWRLRDGGRVVFAALGSDDYVRPAHRRQGLGGMMHAACRMAMEAEGYSVVLGTRTRANGSPLASAGASDVTTVFRYVVPAPLLSALRRVIRPLGGRRARLDPVLPGDVRPDAVFEATADEGRIETVRDAGFYEWRFLRAPGGWLHPFVVGTEPSRPFAACALERLGPRVRIVDLVARDEDFGKALRAIAHAARPFDALELQMTRERAAVMRLWAYGFLPRESMPFGAMVPHGTTREQAAALLDPSRWSLSWADTDLESTWRRAADAPAVAAGAGRMASPPRP